MDEEEKLSTTLSSLAWAAGELVATFTKTVRHRKDRFKRNMMRSFLKNAEYKVPMRQPLGDASYRVECLNLALRRVMVNKGTGFGIRDIWL